MPGFITHYLLGQKTLEELDSNQVSNAISNHPNVFSLGTQGPDLFLYYPGCFLPGKLKGLGSRMHREHTGEYLLTCIREIQKENDPKKKEIFLANVSGILCHYKMDTICHPYIYAKSNYVQFQEQQKPHYTPYHCTLETYIDHKLCVHYLDQLPGRFHANEVIHLSKAEREAIGERLAPCLNRTYFNSHSVINTAMVCDAISKMELELKLLSDPNGWKRKLAKIIEQRILGYPLLSCLIPTDKVPENKDYLNLAHHKWHSPWEEEVRKESFLDLFEKSKEDTLAILHLLNEYLEDPDSYFPLSLAIPDISYNSGLPLEEND
ncbi:hypothetical protein lbkm_0013 [Lachnospiraceae bacterium KM106-2]|nr:hypothetical protein lbkm_0013 [Lachnospiraceae bacterium KM106-2]